MRSEDRNHLLMVGWDLRVNGSYVAAGIDRRFFFDRRKTWSTTSTFTSRRYTHQYASWIEGPVQDGGRYPDPNVILPTGERFCCRKAASQRPSCPPARRLRQRMDSRHRGDQGQQRGGGAPMLTARAGCAERPVRCGHGDRVRPRRDRNPADLTTSWTAMRRWTAISGSPAGTRKRRSSRGRLPDIRTTAVFHQQCRRRRGDRRVDNDAHLFKVVPGNSTASRATCGVDIPLNRCGPADRSPAGRLRPVARSSRQRFPRTRRRLFVAPVAEHRSSASTTTYRCRSWSSAWSGRHLKWRARRRPWITGRARSPGRDGLSFAYWEYHGTQMSFPRAARACSEPIRRSRTPSPADCAEPPGPLGAVSSAVAVAAPEVQDSGKAAS